MENPRDNPLGLDGFEFVEFTGPDPQALAALFVAMGFTHLANHRSKNVRRYAQGDINFLLNMDASGQVADFRAKHGPSANAMAFRVKDARLAFDEALRRGAKPISGPVGPMELNIPAIEGIGGSNLYLVDRYGAREIYDVDFTAVPGADQGPARHRPAYLGSSHPQREPRAHGSLGGFLPADLQFPRNPLLRHRRSGDRIILQGDDGAGRQDPHPAEREPG